jgi:hypothetical protein
MRGGGVARNQISQHPDKYFLSSIKTKMRFDSLKGETLSIFFPSLHLPSELSELPETQDSNPPPCTIILLSI